MKKEKKDNRKKDAKVALKILRKADVLPNNSLQLYRSIIKAGLDKE